ncbi:MAG: glycosyltransferase family 2 protein [Balneolales bacterium]
MSKNSNPPAHTFRRFAVIVPAYNEAAGIEQTIKKLLAVDYPRHLFEVIVIADNCTDSTANFAAKSGAKVWKRNNKGKKGKGYALRWCFDKILSDNKLYTFDSVVVIDADSRVRKNILKVFNNAREQGNSVIQGYFSVESKPGVWTNEIIRIGLTLYNFVRPLGRSKLGLSTGLRGNGMCFSMQTLREVTWDAFSQTEDLEYGMKLLLKEVKISFASEIIGYNEIPETPKNAESQRERWEVGRLPLIKRYTGSLLKEAAKKRSFKIFDGLIDLVTPPLVNMLIIVQVMAGLSFLLYLTGFENSLLFMWLWVFLFCLGLFHLFLGLYAANADQSMYSSVLYVPRYACWKLYIYTKVFIFRRRTFEWVRTPRDVIKNH